MKRIEKGIPDNPVVEQITTEQLPPEEKSLQKR